MTHSKMTHSKMAHSMPGDLQAHEPTKRYAGPSCTSLVPTWDQKEWTMSVCASLVALGLGALLAASQAAYTTLRWIGPHT